MVAAAAAEAQHGLAVAAAVRRSSGKLSGPAELRFKNGHVDPLSLRKPRRAAATAATQKWQNGNGATEAQRESSNGSAAKFAKESEDEEGVRVGKFGKLEVVADEDMGDEDGSEAFDQEAYRRAMAGLRKGRMLPSDLEGMEHD